MRLLVDENVDKLAVVKLRADGHDVFYALEDSPSALDPSLLHQATRERRTMLTFDRGFNELVVRDEIPAPYGVVLFRLPEEALGEFRASLVYSIATSQEQWPPGIWTIRVAHRAG